MNANRHVSTGFGFQPGNLGNSSLSKNNSDDETPSVRLFTLPPKKSQHHKSNSKGLAYQGNYQHVRSGNGLSG